MSDHLLRQLRREQAVIEAMHKRPWWRIGILHRRPWNSKAHRYPEDNLFTWIQVWLLVIHDCQDPMIGCSCTGSFRFPLEDP